MSLEELAGKAKELFGRVTGDKKTEVEGKEYIKEGVKRW